MESIGQILKAARERRQISVADVVAATKMSSVFVQAIEEDNFAVLVAPIYARGFIKLYAGCVGVDPMPLLKQFGASGRSAPVLAPPPAKGSDAYAEKPKPSRLQQNGPVPRHEAAGKSGQEKVGGPSMAAGGAAPSRLVASAPISGQSASPAAGKWSPAAASGDLTASWLASLRAWLLSAVNGMASVRVKWPRFRLPDRILQCFTLPEIVWRRFGILAGVVLLIVAASLAWEWSHRGLPSIPDSCRWLAEPPAPYLTMEISAAKLSR